MITKAEKKVLVSILASAVAMVVLFSGFKIIAAVIAVPALIGVMLSKQKSGYIFSGGSVFCGLSIGLIIDYPLVSYPPALICLVLYPIIFNARNIFFNKIGLHSLLWLDVTFSFLNFFVFVFAAYIKNYDLFQWTIAGVPIFLYAFFSFVIFSDRNDARKKVGNLSTSVGSVAPDFALPDQNGNTVTLKDLLSTKHVLLIFVRGDWCPSCHIMLRGYVKNKDVFAQKDVKVIAIGPDPQGVNKEIMNRIDNNSLLLSDVEQETAFRYISTVQENNPVTKSLYKKGIPLPASFLIHKNGKIIFTSRSDKAGEILQPDKIFEVLAQL